MIDKANNVFIFYLFFASRDLPWTSIVHILDNHSSFFCIDAHDDTNVTIGEIISWSVPYDDSSRSSCLTSFKSCSFCIFEPCTSITSPLHWPIFCHKIRTLTWYKSGTLWIDDFELKFATHRTNCIWYDDRRLRTREK